MSHFFRDIVCS